MIPWIKDLIHRILFDESSAERFVRAILIIIGQVINEAAIPWPPSLLFLAPFQKFVGNALTGGALLIPAGEKNPKA